ncbi:hypothetical protein [Paenibacillus sp. QZ-Y1]|uniref:hypothetical protein n=1 Tax=Paenibacillus sp. QZ-Y1 TaxID=3414511 RepID=UPI003F7A09EE
MICKCRFIGTLVLCTAFMLAACSNQAKSQDVTWKIESSIQQIVSEPESMSSSNPNKYIADSPEAWEQILSTGEEGLGVLIQQLESSTDNGLKEWIMAQASAEMLGERNPVKDWNSGKDWLRQYKMKVE